MFQKNLPSRQTCVPKNSAERRVKSASDDPHQRQHATEFDLPSIIRSSDPKGFVSSFKTRDLVADKSSAANLTRRNFKKRRPKVR